VLLKMYMNTHTGCGSGSQPAAVKRTRGPSPGVTTLATYGAAIQLANCWPATVQDQTVALPLTLVTIVSRARQCRQAGVGGQIR
jgi:hypothetical protein